MMCLANTSMKNRRGGVKALPRNVTDSRVDGPWLDALFNRGAGFSTVYKKRDELHRRHEAGESLNTLVQEAEQLPTQLHPNPRQRCLVTL
jgi:hypothetical protein